MKMAAIFIFGAAFLFTEMLYFYLPICCTLNYRKCCSVIYRLHSHL